MLPATTVLLVMTPSLSPEPEGIQFAIRQPLAVRWPPERTRANSRLCFKRMAEENRSRGRRLICLSRNGLNRSEALAAHAAAIGQGGLAALGRVAIQKTMLPLAANFRWLILTFHCKNSIH